ncbi:MAG TPA: pitrilysin family protein [Pelomicrobium sp.]|nr:pitrilysin family protein [Pelomicrobium sp.]
MTTSIERLLRAAASAALLLLAAPLWAALPIQHWTSASGARVYFVESRGLPIIDVSVDFPAGSSRDTPARSGTAALTQGLLTLGAGGLSENDISAQLADVGAQLGGRFDADRAGLSLRTLSSERERDQSFALLAKVLQQPTFPAEVLEREKARVVAGLREANTKPDTIAGRTLARMMYGSHPYALRESGEVDTVPAITRDDLVGFYRAYYRRGSAVVSIIGDLDRAQAEALAERLTRDLPAGSNPLDLPPAPEPSGGSERVAHPATQSHIALGHPAVRRGDPDHYALLVGNYILGGGGFVSRLTAEVREKRGYAYSVYSYFQPLKVAGPFEIGLQTKNEQAQAALEVVRETLARFLAEGPTDDELKRAKQNIVGGFPLRLDSNRKILDYLALIGFYRLPITYLDDFTRNIEAVTAQEIRDAFRRHVDPARLATVVVGGAGN